jgi:hypothetical protein
VGLRELSKKRFLYFSWNRRIVCLRSPQMELMVAALQGAEVGLRMLQIPRVFSQQNRD